MYDFEEVIFLKTAAGPNITNLDIYNNYYIVRVLLATFVLDTVRVWGSVFICKYVPVLPPESFTLTSFLISLLDSNS